MCCTTKQRSIQIWIFPSPDGSGASGSLSVFYGVYSVCTRDAEGPGDCESGVFITEDVGDKEPGDITKLSVETLLMAFFVSLQTWDCFPQLPK
jgi:hypothetical protein